MLTAQTGSFGPRNREQIPVDCSHLGGPLSEGKLDGDIVQCPWHGSRFSVKDGSVVDGPATFSQPCLETRVSNGQIEMRATRW